MPFYAPKPNTVDFVPPPAGSHAAICYRLIDLGTQQSEYLGQTKRQHKIILSWELPDELMDDGQPFTIHQRYTLSMHEKAALRAHLAAWRGRDFTDDEAAQFDISAVVGKPCLVSIVHNTKDGRTYANVSSVSKMPKGMQTPAPVNPPIVFNLGEPDWTVFEALSNGLKETIAKSPEYAEARGMTQAPNPPAPMGNGEHAELNDEIPF